MHKALGSIHGTASEGAGKVNFAAILPTYLHRLYQADPDLDGRVRLTIKKPYCLMNSRSPPDTSEP